MRTLVIVAFGLWLAAAIPARAGHHYYSDVPANHWAQEGIDALYDNGIYHDTFGNRFYGENILNRYQLAILVAKLLYIQEETFQPWPLERRQLQRTRDRLAKARLDLRDLSTRLDHLTTSLRATRGLP